VRDTAKPKSLSPKIIAALRRDNEEGKRKGWRADIGVDDVDLLLEALDPHHYRGDPMSRTDLWDRASDAMHRDPDPRWHAVADWLRSESACQQQMEPFAELLNVAIEQQSGVKGYLQFGRKADGDLSFLSDTNEGATAVALAYLDRPMTIDPTAEEATE
jgi:hypothetical protein